jgi:hypothetical protein
MKFRRDESHMSVIICNFMISLLLPSSRMKMEAASSTETTATWRHIPEDSNILIVWLHNPVITSNIERINK